MSGRLSLVRRGKSISSTTGQSSLICTEASRCFMGACQTQCLNHDLHWGITVLHGSLSNTMTESWLALRHHGASWEPVKHNDWIMTCTEASRCFMGACQTHWIMTCTEASRCFMGACQTHWIMTCTEASWCFMGACQTQCLNHTQLHTVVPCCSKVRWGKFIDSTTGQSLIWRNCKFIVTVKGRFFSLAGDICVGGKWRLNLPVLKKCFDGACYFSPGSVHQWHSKWKQVFPDELQVSSGLPYYAWTAQ